jgi:hypothetical protein
MKSLSERGHASSRQVIPQGCSAYDEAKMLFHRRILIHRADNHGSDAQVNVEEGRDERWDEERWAAEKPCTEMWGREALVGTAVRPKARNANATNPPGRSPAKIA